MDSMSLGFKLSMFPTCNPSTTNKGVLSPLVLMPRMRMDLPAPG